MLKAKNKNVVDIIFNNKHAIKVYKGVQLVWQKIAEFLHLTQVCGNSVQKLNLFNPNTCTLGQYFNDSGSLITDNLSTITDYIEVQPNITYTIECFPIVKGSNLRVFTYDGRQTKLELLLKRALSENSLNTISFAIPSDSLASYVRISGYLYFSKGANPDYCKIYATTPSPSNPIEIKPVGDKTINLFNKNATQVPQPLGTNGEIYKGCIKVETNGAGTYRTYCNIPTESSFSGYYYLRKINRVTGVHSQAVNYFITPNTRGERTNSFTITDEEDVYVYNAGDRNSLLRLDYLNEFNIMIYQASSVMPYEPYGYKLSVDVNGTMSTCYMEEPLRKVGDEWDEIFRDDDGYHIERRIGKMVLTGTEDWNTNYAGFFNTPISNHIPSALALSNYFVGASGTIPVSTEREGKIWLGSNWLGIGYRALSLANFKAWLGTNNVDVLYPLANSTFEDIEWDNEPEIPPSSDVVFLTEIQPSDYTIE